MNIYTEQTPSLSSATDHCEMGTLRPFSALIPHIKRKTIQYPTYRVTRIKRLNTFRHQNATQSLWLRTCLLHCSTTKCTADGKSYKVIQADTQPVEPETVSSSIWEKAVHSYQLEVKSAHPTWLQVMRARALISRHT